MPKQKGVWREEWLRCDRCGFLHPLSYLRKQKGLLLCSDHGCTDNLTIDRRSIVIAEVLSRGEEGKSEIGDKVINTESEEIIF